MTLGRLTAALLALAVAGACAQGGEEDILTWEEFKALAYQEPETGVFVANGDEMFETEELLYDHYLQWRDSQLTLGDEQIGKTSQGLIVNRVGGQDDRWNSTQAVNLTYCVSQPGFGGNYNTIVNAMNSATATWEGTARVNFIHRSQFDGNCLGATQSQVEFRVLRTSGAGFLARAFFPSSSWSNQTVVFDQSVFGNISPWSVAGVARHELGHVLGFRHEHTRANTGCFEDNNWRALTTYDSASVMHYPQCNGSNGGDLNLTTRDRQGARALYP